MQIRWVFLRLDRLWWWLALLSLLSILGHEIARSSGCGCFASATELEGFGDEVEEDEEEEERVLPPPLIDLKRSDDVDRGPPSKESQNSDGSGAKGTGKPNQDSSSGPASPPPGFSTLKTSRAESVWDEEEFEGIPDEDPNLLHTNPAGSRGQSSKSSPSSSSKSGQKPPSQRRQRPPRGIRKPYKPTDFIIEGLFAVFLVVYAVFYFVGKKSNEKIALAWAEAYASEGGIMEKNFSLLGTGDGVDEPLLLKETNNVFKFYATGRRHCHGLLATLELKKRQDIISLFWYKVMGMKDMITVEVLMNEEMMEPFVLAVAQKRHSRQLMKDNKDLKDLAMILDFSARKQRWPSDELAVISDSREAANEIISDVIVDHLFGEKAWAGPSAKYFEWLHFTDQATKGAHKALLRFCFSLPQAAQMSDLTTLMAAIPFFIDTVGRFKLSSPARAKAETARAKRSEAAEKDAAEARQELIQRKREEKKRAEEGRRLELEARLSPEALVKKQEKERRLAARKAATPKVKLMKMG